MLCVCACVCVCHNISDIIAWTNRERRYCSLRFCRAVSHFGSFISRVCMDRPRREILDFYGLNVSQVCYLHVFSGPGDIAALVLRCTLFYFIYFTGLDGWRGETLQP